MKKVLMLLLIAVVAMSAASAQSAAVISDLLTQKEATWGSAAYLAYCLGTVDEDYLNEDLTIEEAFAHFEQTGLLPANATPDTVFRCDEMSQFIITAFKLPPKSLLYKIFGSKRYAFRQFQHYGLFATDVFPSDSMRGSFFVTFMGDVMRLFPNAKLAY